MEKHYYVYILTNKNNSVLYTGITSNLPQRIHQHKEKMVEGFTKRYNLNKLVYYEVFGDPYSAISREKQIKAGSRRKKITLIEGMNNNWRDLSEEL
jgi:putative endonuclease